MWFIVVVDLGIPKLIRRDYHNRSVSWAARSKDLQFKPDKYRKHLDGVDWSDERQNEWLRALWDLMGKSVDLSFSWDSDAVFADLEMEPVSWSEKRMHDNQRVSNPHRNA